MWNKKGKVQQARQGDRGRRILLLLHCYRTLFEPDREVPKGSWRTELKGTRSRSNNHQSIWVTGWYCLCCLAYIWAFRGILSEKDFVLKTHCIAFHFCCMHLLEVLSLFIRSHVVSALSTFFNLSSCWGLSSSWPHYLWPDLQWINSTLFQDLCQTCVTFCTFSFEADKKRVICLSDGFRQTVSQRKRLFQQPLTTVFTEMSMRFIFIIFRYIFHIVIVKFWNWVQAALPSLRWKRTNVYVYKWSHFQWERHSF